MLGTKIARYRIVEELGFGGMATVWKAHDELLDRTVALKLLKEELREFPEARRRFEREAKTAAFLVHPSIAAVHDWGEADGKVYIAMAYVDGSTLSELATRRLLPVDEALHVAEIVAGALGYGHARGVVHRDVTGRNIMVAKHGGVYVLDFGIALVQGATSLTKTGDILGTLAYIAPEVLASQKADQRSDLYSLGVCLYEALTGCLPFEGDRMEVVSYAALNLPVRPPSQLRPELDSSIDRLVMQALARDRDERHPNAEAFVADLRRLSRLEELPPVRRTPKPSAKSVTVAERIASGTGPIFVAVLPFDVQEPDVEVDGDRGRLLRDLTDAVSAAASAANQVHVVPLDVEEARPAATDLLGFARRTGVNLVLCGQARFAGSAVRVVYSLMDPEDGTQIGGDRVEGSTLAPFEFENRLVQSVRACFGLRDPLLPAEQRGRPLDPAAAERFQQATGYMKRFDNEASLDGAIALLEELCTQNDHSAAYHAGAARAYAYKYQLTQERAWENHAAASCDRAMRIDANAPEAKLAVGELHLVMGRCEEALSQFDQLLSSEPECYEALLGRARALAGLGRHEEAESACQQAVTARPDDWRGYHTLALVLFRQGHYQQACEPWRKTTQLTPDNAGAFRNLGGCYFHTDRYAEAEAAFRKSISMHPNAMGYYNLGTVLFFMEQYDACVEAFEKAVDIGPGDPVAWGNLGNACRLIPGRRERCKEALEHAIGLMREHLERDAGDGEGWARQAGYFVGLARNAEAEAAIEQALKLAPDDVHCLWEAGHVFLLIGDRQKGLEFLTRAVRSGYGPEALRHDPDLYSLRDDPDFQKILQESEKLVEV